MGWRIAQKGDKYRIWSTISDAWLTDWIDRIEAIKFYHDQMLLDFKKEIIKKYLSFPDFCMSFDENKYIMDDKRSDVYITWTEELLTKHEEEYVKFIDETFNKIMRELDEVEVE